MNRNFTLLIALYFFVGKGLVVADDGSLATPPAEPLVKHAPDYSTWTILYTPKEEVPPAATPKNPRFLKQVVVVKAGTTTRETRTWSDGLTSERWVFQKYVLSDQPGHPDIYITRPAPPPDAPDAANSYSSDFPELSWISLRAFKDATSYQGHDCYHFQIAPGKHSPGFEAWIDGKTGLPLAFDNGTATEVYSFESSSTRTLDLPAPFAVALQRYRKIIADATGRP